MPPYSILTVHANLFFPTVDVKTLKVCNLLQHSAISVVDAVAEGEVAVVSVLARVLVVGTLGAEKPVEGSDAENQEEKG